ncbi:hypothetical protein PIROE2DRAFT_12270, partial [Piromyces sp. E2]
FNGINKCNKLSRTECVELKKKVKQDESAAFIGGNPNFSSGDSIVFNRCYFNEFYGYTKVNIFLQKDSIIEKCYFEKGFYYVNKNNENNFYNNAGIWVSDSIIRDVDSLDHGVIVNLACREKAPMPITFQYSIIENTNTDGYGGVVYLNTIQDILIHFNSCKFNNNKAQLGNISYSLDISHEPSFNNKEELIEKFGKKSFVTNPTHIKLNDTINDININIYSGESFSESKTIS